MQIVYILKLEQDKYYVGRTTNLDRRLLEHFNGDGSEWTKKYKPVKLVEKIENCNNYDEDKYTKMYMDKYGIDHVRGGMYTQIILDDNTIKHLKLSSISSNDRCYHCKKPGHFAKQCPIKCPRCGYNTHNEVDCYAIKHKNGYYIDACTRCGYNTHNKENCYATTHKNGYNITEYEYRKARENNICSRCSQKGHYRITCYETKDAHGKDIHADCIIC